LKLFLEKINKKSKFAIRKPGAQPQNVQYVLLALSWPFEKSISYGLLVDTI
jgi:hypothetical protein